MPVFHTGSLRPFHLSLAGFQNRLTQDLLQIFPGYRPGGGESPERFRSGIGPLIQLRPDTPHRR